jgi:hypothetical protein
VDEPVHKRRLPDRLAPEEDHFDLPV